MIQVNPNMQHTVLEIGGERQPVFIADNVLAEPDAFVDMAVGLPFTRSASSFYPGVQTPTPREYMDLVRDRLAPLIVQAYGIPAALSILESQLSLVTVRPEGLQVLQRVPHIDSTSLDRVAILHYMCGPDMGGTSFFRHRRSGFEVITQQRAHEYSKLSKQDADEFGEPAIRYHGDDTAAFEMTAHIEARFNRLVAYRGAILHSGRIPDHFEYSANPRKGRLTINTFADIQKKSPEDFAYGGALSFMR
ncbi:MAG: DUF6445 family protein [Pseudomonadota bacterium]